MMEPAALHPRTPKGRNTRERLLSAARQVFGRQGYTEARVLDIVEEAGISLGAFYRYFRNKDHIFENVIQNLDDDLYQATRSERAPALALHLDPYQTMFVANRNYLVLYERHADLMRAFHEARSVDTRYLKTTLQARLRFRERFVHRLHETAPEQRTFVFDDALTLKVDALINMTEHCAYVWLAQRSHTTYDPQPSVESFARTITDIWYGALFRPQPVMNGGPVPAVVLTEVTRAGRGRARSREHSRVLSSD